MSKVYWLPEPKRELGLKDGWYYCFIKRDSDICNVRYIHGGEAYLCHPVDIGQRCLSEGVEESHVQEVIHMGSASQYERLEKI